MNSPESRNERRDRILAGLLAWGTWMASGVTAVGMILSALSSSGNPFTKAGLGHAVMRAGIALFILLPISRVVVMLVMFLHERDYLYTLISALVLAIILAGMLLG